MHLLNHLQWHKNSINCHCYGMVCMYEMRHKYAGKGHLNASLPSQMHLFRCNFSRVNSMPVCYFLCSCVSLLQNKLIIQFRNATRGRRIIFVRCILSLVLITYENFFQILVRHSGYLINIVELAGTWSYFQDLICEIQIAIFYDFIYILAYIGNSKLITHLECH